MKRYLSILMALTMLLTLAACGSGDTDSAGDDSAVVDIPLVMETYADAVHIALSDSGITADGAAVTGDDTAAVYIANDIVYYEAGHDFTYGEGTEADAHTAEEAAAHTVVHITQPGTYLLTGSLSAGQIAVDLGEDAEKDPEAVVTLVLGGVDITCTVAPGVIFYNVYECGSVDADTATYDVDTSAAGANVIIADGTENTVGGSYVARIYKSVELSEDGTQVVDSKKLHKYDAAFYSKMSMNISGGEYDSGVLNIHAENEGLDSELHLTINGGTINITSGNDGINTNEDYVSVTTVNGGTVNILCDGSTGEGDGIDSNGWLVINGGTVTAQACAVSGDAGIDSDMGIYLNGGTVMATGNMLDRIAGGSATYAVFRFSGNMQGDILTLKNADGEAILTYAPENAFQYLILSADELAPGDYTLWAGDAQLGYSGAMGGGMMGMGNRDPGGMTLPENVEGMELPEGMEGFDPSAMQRPEGMENFDPSAMQRPDGGNMTMPEGAQRPDGEVPELPEGMEQGFGGGRGQAGMGNMDGQLPGGDMTVTFTLTAGENQFTGVAAVTE